MRFVFRTNAGQQTGLGHLVRCVNLARELTARGANCEFMVDCLEPGLAPFLEGMTVHTLYDAPRSQLDVLADARLFLGALQAMRPDWVVLDDYRIGADWEARIQQEGLRLCVIDDLPRLHCCDVLIDVRWRGSQTATTYAALLPPAVRKLLGPGYALLAPEYRSPCPERDSEPFTVMLGLGGAGDLQRVQSMIDNLLAAAADFGRPLRLLPVLGPLMQDTERFIAKYAEQGDIELLIGKTELYPWLCRSDLYIGAAGGILYQLLALGVPALTFALSANQRNDISLLENIGHFFHLDAWSEADSARLPSFVGMLMQRPARIQALCAESPIGVDGYGAQRVAEVLLGESTGSMDQAMRPSPVDDWRPLSPEHRLRAVRDSDINHYLESRNLAANRRNMIGCRDIAQLQHYAWWFEARRDSFLLEKDGVPCLYIWHEMREHEGCRFLIGGWFVCAGEARFQDALLALNWQLEYCDAQYPGAPWIAVINRTNRFVKLLNEYIGFQDIASEHAYGRIIASVFPQASHHDFHFVMRETPNVAEN